MSIEAPPTTRVDPRSLLVFAEVGRHGSMAAAARALGWTQPAVSQHVRRLESAYGVPLIVRVGRGIAPTDAGRALLVHLESISGHLASADRAMQDFARLRTGTVRVAAFPSASATIVAGAMEALAVRHPGIDLRLTQVEPPEAIAALTAGECDVAVVFDYDGAQHAGPRFDEFPLLRDPVFAVLPAENPAAGGASPIQLTDLAHERWVAGCERCRENLLLAATAAGFEPDVRHSTDDYVVVQSIVARGLAVAVLPGLALEASTDSRVAVRPVDGVPDREISALTLPGMRRVPAIGAALDALETAVGQERGFSRERSPRPSPTSPR